MTATRYSRQRELIYQSVCASREHPTAEMVYAALKPEHPGLSLGTVYRNLHLLADEGKLVRMPFPVERFDGGLHPHGHFCCDRCGRVIDVTLPYDDALDADAAAQLDCTDVRHSVVFYGVCRACAQEKDAKNAEEVQEAQEVQEAAAG